MYDMQIHLKEMPFLEGSLHSLGMLNYKPISDIMAKPVVTLHEVEKVMRIVEVLKNTMHNGFPVVNKDGKLRGLILRKTLCGLLKHKAFSSPMSGEPKTLDGGIKVDQAAFINFDQLEKNYPAYPDAKSIKLTEKDLVKTYFPATHCLDSSSFNN